METPLCSNTEAATNTVTCEPCNVAMTVTRVAGGQSVVDKVQKPSIFQDIVRGWNDQEFKGNFHVSRKTFLYLVSELQLDLCKKEFLRCPVSVVQ